MGAPIRHLVMAAAAAGVTLWLDGEVLRIRGPQAAAAVARALRAREDEVRDYLPQACTVCYGPLLWTWPADDRRCTSCRLAAGEDVTPPAMPTCVRCGTALLVAESVERGTCLVCDLELNGRREVLKPTDLLRDQRGEAA